MALTAAEQRELDELEYEALLAEQGGDSGYVPETEATPQSDGINIGGNLLHLLDATGSPTRKLLAQGIDKLTDNKYKLDEGQKGFQDIGQYQGSAEMLRKLGLSEGSKSYIGDKEDPLVTISDRDLIGLGADTLLDPLFHTGAIKKGAQGLGKGVSALAEKVYKLPFAKIDAQLVETGQKAISPILWKYKMSGNVKELRDGLKEHLSKDLWPKIDKIYEAIRQKGDSIMPHDAAQEIGKELEQLSGFGSGGEIKQMQNDIFKEADLFAGQPQGVDELLKSKQTFAESVPYKNLKNPNKPSKLSGDAEASIAGWFRDKIEKMAEATGVGRGKEVSALNQEYGSILNAFPEMSKEIVKQSGRPLVSNMDFGYVLSPYTQKILAGKALAETARLPSVLTKTGVGLNAAGEAMQGASKMGSAIPYSIARPQNLDPAEEERQLQERLRKALGE